MSSPGGLRMAGSIVSIDGLHATEASSKCRVLCREKPVKELAGELSSCVARPLSVKLSSRLPPGYMGSAVSFGEACFAPPSGCPWMDTLGLRAAGQRSAMYPAAARGEPTSRASDLSRIHALRLISTSLYVTMRSV